MLRRLYDWTLSLAARKSAEYWLAFIAFIDRVQIQAEESALQQKFHDDLGPALHFTWTENHARLTVPVLRRAKA